MARRAITASVTTVAPERLRETVRKSKDGEWQKLAWEAYHSLGEVRFGARYIGNGLSRVRFRVCTREAPGEPLQPIPADATGTDADVRDLLLRIRGRDGTIESLIRAYGAQHFIAGENYLVGEDGPSGERWEFLSTSEIKIESDKKYARVGSDGSSVDITGKSLVLRFWQRDPEFRDRADSALRSVLDLCDALITAQAMQTAADRSRLALAGLLLFPSEAELPRAQASDDNGVADGEDPGPALVDDIVSVASLGIENPGSAASLIPIVVEMKADLIEHVKLLRFGGETDQTIVERINHLIRRLAQGVDLPPEKLLGIGDLNHWSAWAVAEETVQAHIAPLAAAFCEDLTAGYLHPAMLQELKIDSPEARSRYAIGFDPSDLVSQPDKIDHLFWLYDHFLIKGQVVVEAVGFAADQMPDDAEVEARRARESGGQPEPAPAPAAPAAPAPEPSPSNPDEGPPADGPPDGGTPADGPAAAASAVARAYGAAEMAVERALERANARVRSAAQRNSQARSIVEGRDASTVAALLGPAQCASLGMHEDALLDGAWDVLAPRLRRWGIESPVVAAIVQGCDEYARARLWRGSDPDASLAVEQIVNAAIYGPVPV